MRLNFIVISSLFFGLLFTTCIKNTSEDLSTAEVTEAGNWQVDDSLSLNPAADLSKQLVYPTFISTNGDFLTVITELDEGVLKFFSIKDYSFIEEFGRRGEGPGEFSSPPFKMNELPKHEPVISLLDWGKKSYYRINISDLINSNEWKPKIQVSLPPELILTQRTIYLEEDSSMIGFGGIREGKLYKYNMKKDSILTYTPFIPELEKMTERHNPSYLYSGYMTVNRNKKKIAVVSDYFEQLEIYDYDLNLLQITRLRKEPNFIGDWRSSLPVNSETVTYYNDIDTYGNNIYVLYDNRSMEDRKAGICSEEASELHIFNWSGEPLHRYQLEECPRRIAYDHINDRIIGRFITKDSAKTIGYYQL